MINLGHGISTSKNAWDTIQDSQRVSSFVVNLSRALWNDNEMAEGCFQLNSLKKPSCELKRKLYCPRKINVIKCK